MRAILAATLALSALGASLHPSSARAEDVACTVNCNQAWNGCTVFAIGTGYRECEARRDACWARCNKTSDILGSSTPRLRKAHGSELD